eukprot:TRINITY_DN1684_c0_g1_i1.p1 TRINITY_DN1684_c0_g1~~TRINITY_DN1684_c0_g1_i1.p1  ORF type:complete len:1269 (-),score=312.12 TRINITY_DN1684_c0_g1_i1:42-3494(-)
MDVLYLPLWTKTILGLHSKDITFLGSFGIVLFISYGYTHLIKQKKLFFTSTIEDKDDLLKHRNFFLEDSYKEEYHLIAFDDIPNVSYLNSVLFSKDINKMFERSILTAVPIMLNLLSLFMLFVATIRFDTITLIFFVSSLVLVVNDNLSVPSNLKNWKEVHVISYVVIILMFFYQLEFLNFSLPWLGLRKIDSFRKMFSFEQGLILNIIIFFLLSLIVMFFDSKIFGIFVEKQRKRKRINDDLAPKIYERYLIKQEEIATSIVQEREDSFSLFDKVKHQINNIEKNAVNIVNQKNSNLVSLSFEKQDNDVDIDKVIVDVDNSPMIVEEEAEAKSSFIDQLFNEFKIRWQLHVAKLMDDAQVLVALDEQVDTERQVDEQLNMPETETERETYNIVHAIDNQSNQENDTDQQIGDTDSSFTHPSFWRIIQLVLQNHTGTILRVATLFNVVVKPNIFSILLVIIIIIVPCLFNYSPPRKYWYSVLYYVVFTLFIQFFAKIRVICSCIGYLGGSKNDLSLDWGFSNQCYTDYFCQQAIPTQMYVGNNLGYLLGFTYLTNHFFWHILPEIVIFFVLLVHRSGLRAKGLFSDSYISFGIKQMVKRIGLKDFYSQILGFDGLSIIICFILLFKYILPSKTSTESFLPSVLVMNFGYIFISIVLERYLYLKRHNVIKFIWNCLNFVITIYLNVFWIPTQTKTLITNSVVSQLYLFLRLLSIYLSCKQSVIGYPVHVRNSFLTRKADGFRAFCVSIFKSLPFVYQMKVTIDYFGTKTPLNYNEEITFQDMYFGLFQAKCQHLNKEKKLEKSKGDLVFPGFMLLLFLLLLVGPLFLYSTFNPGLLQNRPTGMSLDISCGSYLPLYLTNKQYDINPIVKKEFETFRNDQTFKDVVMSDMYKISFFQYSESVWEITPPQKQRLVVHLNKFEVRFPIRLSGVVKKQYSADESFSFEHDLTNEERIHLANVLNDSISDVSLSLKNILPKGIFFPNNGDPVFSQINNDIYLKYEDKSYWKVNVFGELGEFYVYVAVPAFPKALGKYASGGLIGFYTSVVLVAWNLIKPMFTNRREKIPYEQLKYPDLLLSMCVQLENLRDLDVDTLELQRELYDLLILIHRHLDLMATLTQKNESGLSDDGFQNNVLENNLKVTDESNEDSMVSV